MGRLLYRLSPKEARYLPWRRTAAWLCAVAPLQTKAEAPKQRLWGQSKTIQVWLWCGFPCGIPERSKASHQLRQSFVSFLSWSKPTSIINSSRLGSTPKSALPSRTPQEEARVVSFHPVIIVPLMILFTRSSKHIEEHIHAAPAWLL